MQTALLAIVAAAAVVIAAAVVRRLLRSERGQAGELAGELAGRLSQLTEASAAAQVQLAERLQAQERALARSLDERLGDVTKRVNEALDKASTQQRSTLDDLKERLVKIDVAQRNITELSSQVVGLQDILANKQARGAFGEIQLRDLVEAVLPPSAYAFQVTLTNNKRVDCLLHLPLPPGPICIDAKFPLESYRALIAARDEAATKEATRLFAADVLRHVRDIAEKYIIAGETAEAALMFLPSEAVYAELHARFPEVVEKSFRAHVFIVSPTTLWATLNTVRAVMKDVRIRGAAGHIQTEVHHLLDDVVRLDKRVYNLQRHFQTAETDMREIRITTEKITKRSGRIEDLQLDDVPHEPEVTAFPAPAARAIGRE